MGDSTPMSMGECRKTRAGVTYCRLDLGTRFCPRGAETAEECRRRIAVTGDRRRGKWERRKLGVSPPPPYYPRGEVI